MYVCTKVGSGGGGVKPEHLGKVLLTGIVKYSSQLEKEKSKILPGGVGRGKFNRKGNV